MSDLYHFMMLLMMSFAIIVLCAMGASIMHMHPGFGVMMGMVVVFLTYNG